MPNTTPLSFVCNRKIFLNFEGGEMSSDTGMLLMHEFCDSLGVKKLLERSLPECRQGVRIHKKPEIIYQEIFRIIAGYPSNNTAFFLKEDPIFQKIHPSGVASSATCCRMEQSFSVPDLKGFQHLQERLLEKSYELESPEKMIFDLDTTYDPASSNLHGANYNAHYKETGFSPLVCFNGINGDMIKGDLRPGNTHCSKNVVPFFSPILKRYAKKDIPLRTRADSAFATPQIYEMHERQNAEYYIKMKMNAVLKVFFKEEVKKWEVEEGFEKLRQSEREVFFECKYGAQSWGTKRRILARIQWKGDELFPVYSAIVTNDQQIPPKDGFAFYNGRATIENSIEEGKNGFSWDHLSHKNFEQNRVKFQVFLTAALLTNLFRRLCVPVQKEKSTIQTLRIILFKVASRLVKGGRKFFFKCASSFPFQALWKKTLENIHFIRSVFAHQLLGGG